MAESEEDWIRRRAYALWEQEGYPAGKDREHWEQAKLEYATQVPTASVKAPKAAKADAKAKPAAKKAPPEKISTSKPAPKAAAAKSKSSKKVPAGA